MAKCIKCGKEHSNLFRQWVTNQEDIECDICEDCIRDYKMYATVLCYSQDMDMTFIFVEARVYLKERPIDDRSFVLLSQTLIGYVYGKPEYNRGYADEALQIWLRNQGNDRLNLLRQNFNENNRNEEVLY